MSKEVVLTGLRSNAEFHLGNYLGAILSVVELQKKHADQYQINMFIPDLHSFTTPIDHEKLYNQSLQNLKVFVAAGLDIDDPNTFIYRQSYIPAHSELTWILDCFSSFGELSRMTQFKEKTGRKSFKHEVNEIHELGALLANVPDEFGPDWGEYDNKIWDLLERIDGIKNQSVTVGLFNYPVLMAADILLYGAKWIPVGEDQRQHVEFTRDLAIRMNNRFKDFGDLFTVPEDNTKQTEFAGRSEPIRIRSLRNPERKMSKSVEDPAGTIMLSDDPEEAAKKIMSATTDDFNRLPSSAEERSQQPGITNLMTIKALLTGNMNIGEGNTQGYAFLKQQVAKDVKEFLTDFQTKLSQVDEAKLMSKLEADEKAMTEVANATLLKVQKAVGLRPQ